MARFGPESMQVKLTTSSATTAYRDISNQVVTFSGFTIEGLLEQVHGFGDTWEESAFVGVRRAPAITMGGPWDNDTTTGVAGILGVASDVGAERSLRLNFVAGATGTTGAMSNLKMDVIVQSFTRTPARGALTQWQAVLQPTGNATDTTTTGA